MQDFCVGEISAFEYISTGQALLQNETVCCWAAQGADGSRGLLWRIYLSCEALEAAWNLSSGSCPPPEQADRLVLDELEKQSRWAQEHPGVLLGIVQFRVQPYLLDPSLRELYLLTEYAQPLRKACPAGLRDEKAVQRLGLALCRVCRSASAAGFLPQYLHPDCVFLSEQGEPLLTPLWPGADSVRPEGFWIDDSPAHRQGYSAAMLLFWLLNGGEAPFAQDAARSQDAEKRRLSGEPLPAVPGVSAGLCALLSRICRLPAGSGCTTDELERGLSALSRPEEEAVRLAREEEERLRREEEEEARQEEQAEAEEQLRRDREKQERRAERDLGSDAGDRRMLGGLIAGIAVVAAAVCLFFGMQALSRLQNSMDAGNYATALEQIEKSYAAGENVDELVEVYAEECLQNSDYIRAMAAYSYYSESAPDADRLQAVVDLTIQSGEPRRAEKFLSELAEKSEECAVLAQQIYEQYSEEFAS